MKRTDLLQLKSGDKVKLKLVQPPIMCVDRERKECYYRGKVVQVFEYPGFKSLVIKFKYKGKWVLESYSLNNDTFNRGDIEDIKIVG